MSQRKTPEDIWTVWNSQTPLGDTGDYMYSCGITDGTNSLYLESETDDNEILPELCKKLNAKQEVEARDEIIKELTDQLDFAMELLRGHEVNSIDYNSLKSTLTKAQSFNQE